MSPALYQQAIPAPSFMVYRRKTNVAPYADSRTVTLHQSKYSVLRCFGARFHIYHISIEGGVYTVPSNLPPKQNTQTGNANFVMDSNNTPCL